MADFSLTLNPVWQCLTIVNIPGSFAAVTGFTEWLKIPNKAGATFADRFDMIDSKLIKGKFLIARQAVEGVELAEAEPFIGCVSASGLGLTRSSNDCIFPIFFFPSRGLSITMLSRLLFRGALMFFIGVLSFITSIVNPSYQFPAFCLAKSFCRVGSASFASGVISIFSFRVLVEVIQRLGVRFDTIRVVANLQSFRKQFVVFISMWSITFACFTLGLKTIPSTDGAAKIIMGLRVSFKAIRITAMFQPFFKKMLPQLLLLFRNHILAPFKQTIKPLISSIRRTPIASSDLTNEGLDNNNNYLGSVKQKSPCAIGTRYYTTYERLV